MEQNGVVSVFDPALFKIEYEVLDKYLIKLIKSSSPSE
ncbi:HNH homing endonuclease [Pseudomonas phage vB_PA32_GUMS]|nr:HNH homing endonuclease [Pseudomonas phage vB_PA32_GUMS]